MEFQLVLSNERAEPLLISGIAEVVENHLYFVIVKVTLETDEDAMKLFNAGAEFGYSFY
jgi:hypothetical protein